MSVSFAVKSQSISGAWSIGDGEASNANIPVFQFDGEALSYDANRAISTVVIAAGIVRGHVGHFSHFLVDYVSYSAVQFSSRSIDRLL